ncbi:MAG TPA: GDSL-type esterase/lipase family protein [Acidimicrobiales bacterium]|nr:GDSL-type esterase/lipase family protein [Acidimicrobiales bacterium]
MRRPAADPRAGRWRRAARASTTACAAAVTVSALLVSSTSAGAALRPAVRPVPYYVAIGASDSVGVQPEPWDHHGVRTDEGYADDLTRMERQRWPGLRLADFGCPGITVQGALDGVGSCPYPAGSEIATATDFIRAHRGDVAFVTVDLGFNDIWPCLVRHTVDERCVGTNLVRIATELGTVLAELRAAGGTGLLVVGLEHADPYVADALFGKATFAKETVAVFERLNALLAATYHATGAVVASVPPTRGRAAGLHALVTVCARTWMCTDDNVHPTPRGYHAIAEAIAAAIASAPSPPPS